MGKTKSFVIKKYERKNYLDFRLSESFERRKQSVRSYTGIKGCGSSMYTIKPTITIYSFNIIVLLYNFEKCQKKIKKSFSYSKRVVSIYGKKNLEISLKLFCAHLDEEIKGKTYTKWRIFSKTSHEMKEYRNAKEKIKENHVLECEKMYLVCLTSNSFAERCRNFHMLLRIFHFPCVNTVINFH